MNVKITADDNTEIKYTHSFFPAGEEYVRVDSINEAKNAKKFRVTLLSADSSTIIKACLLADALKFLNTEALVLAVVTYLPYGRQDRVCQCGESFSLKLFAEIMEMRFDEVVTLDRHSEMSGLVFSKIRLMEYDIDDNYILLNKDSTKNVKMLDEINKTDHVIISPDKGAIKRSEALFEKTCAKDLVYLDKVREGGSIHLEFSNFISAKTNIDVIKNNNNFVVSDDICDGGGTFMGLSKFIKAINPDAKLTLIVSHGIFSAGVNRLLSEYDRIFVCDTDYNRGRISLDQKYLSGMKNLKVHLKDFNKTLKVNR